MHYSISAGIASSGFLDLIYIWCILDALRIDTTRFSVQGDVIELRLLQQAGRAGSQKFTEYRIGKAGGKSDAIWSVKLEHGVAVPVLVGGYSFAVAISSSSFMSSAAAILAMWSRPEFC